MTISRMAMQRAVWVVGIVCAVQLGGSPMLAHRAASGAALKTSQAPATFEAAMAIGFQENRGQLDSPVRYYARGPRYAFYLTSDDIRLSFLSADSSRGHALTLTFPGASAARRLVGQDRAGGDLNYFIGRDPSAWRTSIPHFATAAYRDLWPGIDLLLTDHAGTLKYEFRVRPGARPSDIRLAYSGADRLSVDASGALSIATTMGALRDEAPTTYQIVHGERVVVRSRYAVVASDSARHEYGFSLDQGYDTGRELIIDPGIQYSTFIGGSSHELGNGIKVDANGNAYVVGTTQSPDFPTRPGAFRRTGAASNFADVFVAKLNAAGNALLYSTFIGGNDMDFGRAIAIDVAGNAYVTGQTKSPSFPTTGGAFDRTFNVDTCPRCGIDQYDAFVTKLNATGSALVYSSFLGGFDIDDGLAIAIDSAGNAYVTGETDSQNFPTTANAFDRTKNGASDAFVTKVNANGSAIAYSTYVGGSAVELATRIAVDAAGNAFIVGTTSSPEFPTTPGSFDRSANGTFDAFVTKLNAAGSALIYSTFLGGPGFDGASGLTIDASGNAYVSGGAGSVDFPTTPGAFDSISDGSSAFVSKLNPSGSALIYSTFLNGSGNEGANAIALDAQGNAWLTGITNSTDFPVTPDAFSLALNGVADAFVSELSADGSRLLYSTYVGGTQSDGGDDLALVQRGVYVTGHTYSLDFPTTAGAFDIVFDGDRSIFWGDAFVTKFAIDATSSTPPSTPPVPGAPVLLAPASGSSPTQPITFDWSDVSGAASYQIQIDDANTFAAPLIRNVTVSASQYVTNGMSTALQFWRVRALNTAGAAGAWSAVRTVQPQPAPPLPTLSTLSTNPSTVVGGDLSSGTAVLTTSAQEGGAAIVLTSSNPAVASVPSSALAPSNSFTATFTITTSPVTTSTVVTITATYNGATRTATVTVTPQNAPPSITLQTLTLNQQSVVGGTSVQGTVVLSTNAPQGGAVVALSSANPGVVSVPSNVTIAPGVMFANFTATTTAVTASTPVSIGANYNGSTRSTSLTVTAPQSPPQNVSLTVTATGRSGERVTSSPAGLSVGTGTTGSANFASGTSVTLSVTNGRDAIWSGACSSGGAKQKTCRLTLNSAASVSANVQ